MLEGDGQIRKRKRGWTGSYGNIWDVIQGFEFILEQLERFKDIAKDFPDPEHFRININLGWQKLNEYYEILSETPIYYAGLALHPAYRWKWFERNWNDRPEWIDEAKKVVHDVWRLSIGRPLCPERTYQPLSQFLSSGRLQPIHSRNTFNETAT
ncbi:restless-like transposase [Ilyonectria robusta]